MDVHHAKKDLDPVVQILVHRVMTMRRELAKRKELKEEVKTIVKKYESWKEA